MDLLRKLRKAEVQVNRLRRRCMYRIMDGSGLHPGQPPLLRVISEIGPCTQTEIAKKLDCSASSIAVSLKRLESAGYINKESSKTDLRYNTVSLSDKGRKAVADMETSVDALDKMIYSGFSDEEIELFISLFERAYQNLENCYEKFTGECDHN